ncbi:alpha,alpha-trehalose-phosphate synthase (UDP-forming) [Natrarchaeobius chitinivorans]|uniref:Trehalose-6-phosphate synthase n=1 Tax=Natrarchaeobius chitinivorans TaxID=1679083 RepID=A0A3N6P686_NATCH|nr:trehalose-6-phosphate synthase [Natrarchaeobius chitinivorans]RQG93799.1 trehalose-6-phosphate synthase [Natrarchaeobius chitinivorans]
MRFPDERLSLTNPYSRQLRCDGRGRTSDDASDEAACPGPLIVVSNRQPYRHEYDDADAEDDTERSVTVDEPTGGLTAGLDPVCKRTDGTWIAWGDGSADFDVTDDRNCVSVPPDSEGYTLHRLDLSEAAVDSYYRGFSNRVLWPICHGFSDLLEDRPTDFEWYRTVNERFASAVADHATDDSVVWIQDYHFALAPRLVRDSIPPSATVAQFWHIPWPAPETFRDCPAGVDVLEGVLGNDLLGFHVDRYVENFLECVQRYVPNATVDRDQRLVRYEGEPTTVVATPMGVDAASFDRRARAADRRNPSALLTDAVSEETVVGLGVDRLDYTKGIPERLAALERFFERNPDWCGEFTFVQKATPSRTEIPTYERYGEFVRNEVERINGRFESGDWKPIVYTEEYVEPDDLCALYRQADVMIVSPIIDGMNLVAQEYLAASVDCDGALLLSDRTGAYERLGSHALGIDPTDTDAFARRIAESLSMPRHERRRRMNTLRHRVFENDIGSWMDSQFDWIQSIHEGSSSEAIDQDPDTDPDSPEYTPRV